MVMSFAAFRFYDRIAVLDDIAGHWGCCWGHVVSPHSLGTKIGRSDGAVCSSGRIAWGCRECDLPGLLRRPCAFIRFHEFPCTISVWHDGWKIIRYLCRTRFVPSRGHKSSSEDTPDSLWALWRNMAAATCGSSHVKTTVRRAIRGLFLWFALLYLFLLDAFAAATQGPKPERSQ